MENHNLSLISAHCSKYSFHHSICTGQPQIYGPLSPKFSVLRILFWILIVTISSIYQLQLNGFSDLRIFCSYPRRSVKLGCYCIWHIYDQCLQKKLWKAMTFTFDRFGIKNCKFSYCTNDRGLQNCIYLVHCNILFDIGYILQILPISTIVKIWRNHIFIVIQLVFYHVCGQYMSSLVHKRDM